MEGNKERYRLEWPGKKEAIVTANLPTTKTLRPVREDSVDFETTENIYIEGDNLEVLKLLQESYLGKIKMIYIDPPYNTGNDFVYVDNFKKESKVSNLDSGIIDDKGNILSGLKDNPATAGRYHSDWLSMMYPRLKLARNLLIEGGVIFISIDNNEVHNLRKLCDEIFGEDNFVTELIWKSRQIVDSRNKNNASIDHEAILSYSKRMENFSLLGKEISLNKYSNPDNDPRGPWMSNSILGLANASQRPNLHYSIFDPKTGNEFSCPPDTGWRYSVETMSKKIDEERIVFPKKKDGRPREKKFLTELSSRFTGLSSILPESAGFTLNGSREVRDLFGKKYFDFPKPVSLIEILIKQGTLGADDIILDFYSGSATTAHATMQLNAEDGGKRKFIQVQLPEPIDEKSEACKAGYKNICEIGKDRIRRAAKKIKEEKLEKVKKDGLFADFTDKQDYGFRVYRLDSSNMQDVYYRPQDYQQSQLDAFADNIKPDRSPDDLLTQILLDWGLPLSLKISTIEISGKKVYQVAENSLYACFDSGIDEDFAKEIAKDSPLRVVFRDSGFKNDTAKVNVRQLLKQLSPETEMKVI
uniref:site-specific DNA-methyltransferase n=1 Tax=Algoriphagus locisalis TaxID=305507 RepID=UPI001FCE2A7A|nr:site-specific DNA-methyltransferase [Algoriphagus locisalis]